MSLPTTDLLARLDRLRDRIGPERALVALLALVALWYLTNLEGAVYVDEPAYTDTGWAVFEGNPYHNPTHIFAPVGKYLIGASMHLLGPTTVASRLPVALLGVGTLYLVYRLGARIDDPTAGLLAALLLGTTYFFATFSVMAMLDVPLAFFFTGLVVAAVVWTESGEREGDVAAPDSGGWRSSHALVGVAVGALAAATVTTKAQGFVYAFPVVAAVAVAGWRRNDFRGFVRSMAPPIAGGLGALALIYLPYVLVPHPPVEDAGAVVETLRSTVPLLGAVDPIRLRSFLLDLYRTPVAGNIAYVFSMAVVRNFAHLGGGHAIVVAGSVHQYPPAWTYLWWLLGKGGIVYPAALALSVGYGAREAVVERDASAAVRWVALVVPLLGLSYVTVKFPRYALPLFPLLAVGGVVYGRRALGRLREAVVARTDDPRVPRAAVAVLVAVVLLGAAQPVVATGTRPLAVDTGFDEAGAAVDDYAAERPGEDVVVLAYHTRALRQYVSRPNVEMRWYTPSDVGTNDERFRRLRRQVASGEVDLVVTLRDNPRARGTRIFDYVREHGEPIATAPMWPRNAVSNLGQELVVYRMLDDDASG